MGERYLAAGGRWEARLREALRRRGTLGVARRAAQILLSPVVRYEKVVEVRTDLGGPIPDLPVPPAFEVRMGGEADVPLLAALNPNRKGRLYCERCTAGMIPFLVLHEGGAVAVAWLALGSFYDPRLRLPIELSPDEAYGFDTYTAPSLRHRGLHNLLHIRICQHCRGLGKRWLKVYYSVDQAAPVERNLQRLGMHYVTPCQIISLTAFGRAHRWRRTLPSRQEGIR